LSLLSARADGQLVRVETLDGRTLQGEVDERSDGNSLWIRRTEGQVILVVNVAWDAVSSVEIDGEQVEVAQFESDYQRLATAAPATFLTEFEPLQLSITPQPLVAERRPGRITSIEVAARIANLDRTVESDGLLVDLAVFDDHGFAVPVRGSLSARLIVERLDQHTGAVSFEEFQRWSAPVSFADFDEGVATLPLRYQRLSPEFRWDLCTAALLNVRLGVAGQGNFEASVPVAIQEFNPFRDALRNQQGSRFFRDELTGNTRHSGPMRLYQGSSPPRGFGF
jgi:hypothetical protein